MIHDPARVFAEILRFHESPSKDVVADLDDFTLMRVRQQHDRVEEMTLLVRTGLSYDMELRAIHSFVRHRGRLFLQDLRIMGGKSILSVMDPADLSTLHFSRGLPAIGRIRPAWGADLLMTIDVRSIVPIDLVLVFDRHPLTTPTEEEQKAFNRQLLASFSEDLSEIRQKIDVFNREGRD